jgi:hypothetical protein
MKKLLTSVCAFAVGAAIGLSVDLRRAAAMPPLSIGLMQPVADAVKPSYSRPTLVSTTESAILKGGTAKSISVTAPAGAEIVVVAVMPDITDEPPTTLNGTSMRIVAESERSQIAWGNVKGGLNYTIGWGSSVQMVGSAVYCWWFKDVSTINPVVGGRRDPTGLSDWAPSTCFSGGISALSTSEYAIRFFVPTSVRPYICAVTSVQSKATKGSWQTQNLNVVGSFFSESTLTAAVATNGNLGSANGLGTVGFKLANSGAAQFQQMCMCEVIGLTTGYPELYTGHWGYNPSKTGLTKSFSAVDFGPAPKGKRLVVVAGQTINKAAQMTKLTIAGINAKLRVMSGNDSLWRERGCWIGWAEVPTGASGNVTCSFDTDGGETAIQVYSIYSNSSLSEVFGQSRSSGGAFDVQSEPWQFIVISAAAEGKGTTYVNDDYAAGVFYAGSVASTTTQSGYSVMLSGVVATNVNTGPFAVTIKERGDPIAGVMSVFG